MPRGAPSSRASRPLRVAPPASPPRGGAPPHAGAGAPRSPVLPELAPPPPRCAAATRVPGARQRTQSNWAVLPPLLLLLSLALLPSLLPTAVTADSKDVPTTATPASTRRTQVRQSTKPSQEAASSGDYSPGKRNGSGGKSNRVPGGGGAAGGSISHGQCSGKECKQLRAHPKQQARHASNKLPTPVRDSTVQSHSATKNPVSIPPSTIHSSSFPSPSKKVPSSSSFSSSSSNHQAFKQKPAATVASGAGAAAAAAVGAGQGKRSKAYTGKGYAAASPLQRFFRWLGRLMGRRKRKRLPRPAPVDPRLGLGPAQREVYSEEYSRFNPQSAYLTAGLTFDPATSAPNYLASLPSGVDYSSYLSPPRDQGMCAACWAFAVAGAVEGAFQLQSYYLSPAAMLAVQQVLDCAPGSCRGGYPQDALQMWTERNVTLDAVYTYKESKGECLESVPLAEPCLLPLNRKPATSTASSIHLSSSSRLSSSTLPSPPSPTLHPLGFVSGFSVGINMFEQVPLPGAVGLMLVLAKQPVVVTIYASMPDFQEFTGSGVYSNSECFDPANPVLDHVMLAVGYQFLGASSDDNYFILRNSWGTEWGDCGYIKIAMTGAAAGICGMTYERGLYPVLHEGDLYDSCAMSPCGGGTCTATAGGSYTCDCSDPLVLAYRRDGKETCGLKKVCSVFPSNPCGTGQCVDLNAGTYMCVCPSNYRAHALSSGILTCVPSGDSTPLNSYQVQQGDTCYGIYVFHGLSEAEFLEQNQEVDCNNLQVGSYVQVERTSKPACSVRYPISQADSAAGSCEAINARFSIDAAAVNPGLDCSNLVPGQQICIEWSDFERGTSNYALCTQYRDITPTTTCDSIHSDYGLSWRSLYRYNPGIICDNINGLSGQEVCVAGQPLGAVLCGPSRSRTVRNRKYTVQAGDSCASLVVDQFKRQFPLVAQLNRGWMCRSQSLFEGMPLCIPI
ncbi:hypothetical protein CLOM_g14541 [Closterium sp. NIES-68]|nr:hypothetical protein CLOM_g14541 [Closterium sp. NIES-68]GJP64853.1 hypothetical protein CLOP_g21792 [Closterium sp. NIES-67]